MKTNRKKKVLTFGDFIAAIYGAWESRRAEGIVRLVVNARLVQFPGQRIVISEPALDNGCFIETASHL